jgi:transcriptional regulator with XRE-family HTH domain
MVELRQVPPTTKQPHFATLLLMALAPGEVGKRIAQARKAKGWTHGELAERMNVDLRTAQRWQKGVNSKGKSTLPRLGTLMELADVLDVPRSYFVELEDEGATLADLRAGMVRLEEEVAALRQDLKKRGDGGRGGSREGQP